MQSRWQNSFYRRVEDRRFLGFLGRISKFHWSGLASFLLCNSLTPGLGTCTSCDGHQQRVPVLTPQGKQLCLRPGAALGLPWWEASLSPAFGAQSSIFPRTGFLLLSSLCSYTVSDPTTPTFLRGRSGAGVCCAGLRYKPGTFFQLPPGIWTTCPQDCENQTSRAESICLTPHPWLPASKNSATPLALHHSMSAAY